MIAGGLAVLLIVFGALCLWGKDKVSDKLKGGRYVVGVMAMLSILGAGTLVLKVPDIGPWIASLAGWAQGVNGLLGLAVAGCALALAVMWIGAALPDKVFSYDPPDWLAYAGLAIPSLLSSLPGSFGQGLADLIDALARGSVEVGAGWFT
jgi:hypothetical protein